jgi:chemotaxis protein MotC
VTASRFARALAATAIVAGLALGAAAAAETSIAELTFDLQALQARIAAGDKAAYASQAERIAAIGAAIVAAKPDVWQSKRETDAVVIYLLSGGQPRDVVRLLESGAVPSSEIPLIRGSLAYALGNEAEAEKRLKGIDASRLPARLAGPMAFAQSVIETGSDPAKAIALLDLARLLAPGTLVEEAALRREIMLHADRRDVDSVAQLARQYASRFGASIYADSFLQTLAGALAQTGAIESAANLDKFQPFFAALNPDMRRVFLLGLARGVAAFLRQPPESSAAQPIDVEAVVKADPNDAAAQTIVLAEAALGRTASLAAAPKGTL